MKRLLALLLALTLIFSYVPEAEALSDISARLKAAFAGLNEAVQKVEAESKAGELDYDTLQESFSAAHKELATSPTAFNGVSRYIVTDTSTANLLSQAEIEALMAENPIKQTLTRAEALADADLFFRTMKASYGAYYYFGADKFDAAKAEVNTWLQGKTTVSQQEFEQKLADSMAFAQDAHMAIGRVDRGRELEYEYYYCDVVFRQDGKGYYRTENGEKWYFQSFSDSRVRMELTLTEEGEIVYSPILFCPEPDMKNSTLKLKNTAGKTKTLNLTFTRNESYWGGYYNDHGYNYVEEDGVAYISLRSCSGFYHDTLEEYAKSGSDARDAKLVIFDLRGNGGGSELYSMEWIMNFIGYGPSLPLAGGTRYSKLRTAMGFDGGQVEAGIYQEYQQNGRWIENNIPIIVLVDEYVASAGESTLNYLRAMDNVTVVGSNSGGLQLCGNNMGFTLPNSGTYFYFGTGLNFVYDMENKDFRGYEPDIWANPKTSLDAVMKMVDRYEIGDATVGNISDTLDTVVTEKSSIRLYLVMDLITGEFAPDPELEPGERCGMPTIDASQCWMVYKDGEPRSDYKAWSANPDICKITEIDGWCNDTVFEARVVNHGTCKFYVTVDDETAEFIFFAG